MILILLVHIFIMNENVKSGSAFSLSATLATDWRKLFDCILNSVNTNFALNMAML